MSGELAKLFADTVDDVIRQHPAFNIVKGGQKRLVAAGMEPRAAWRRSRDVLIEFLDEEKIKLGDPDYAWDEDAGATLVEEYELQFWEHPQ